MHLKPRLLIFDVNETLLDLSPLKEEVNRVLQHTAAFDIWFRMLLHYSLVETITGSYRGFGDIGKATFTMLANQLKMPLADGQVEHVLGRIRHLPPHSDVIAAFSKLRKAGFKMMVLTNSSTKVMTAQLEAAAIGRYLDTAISVEQIKKYKPHRDVYRFALEQFKLPPSEAMMIAAHAWDVLGAQRCGLQTALILRQGKQPYPLARRPDLMENDLLDLAGKFITT